MLSCFERVIWNIVYIFYQNNMARYQIDFTNMISRLMAGGYEENIATFQGKYMFQLLENWKPWPYLPDEFFENCVLACCAQEKARKVSASKDKEVKLQPLQEPVRRTSIVDFTGNPLEFIYDFNLADRSLSMDVVTTRESTYKPLPIDNARFLCDLYRRSWDENPGVSKIPLYVLTDGGDKDGTVFLGFSANKSVVATSQGIFSNKNEYPELQAIISRHLASLSESSPKTEKSVYIYYDIRQFNAQLEPPRAAFLKPIESEVLALECTGKDLSSIMQKPCSDYKCMMLIQAVMGDDLVGASAKFKELKVAKALFDCLRTGEMVWPTRPEASRVFERLNIFLEGLREAPRFERGEENIFNPDGSDFDIMLAFLAVNDHDDMDSTDHLWIILSGCSSSAELIEAFRIVFRTVEELPSAPYVCWNNRTRIAKMMRDMERYSKVWGSFEYTDAIEWLLEIGVEKLRKDYTNFFLSLEMVPRCCLLPYFDQFKNTEAALNCLQKFHTVLELLIICSSMLHLPKEELKAFARLALKHYAAETTVDPSHVFRFEIPLSSVKGLIDRIHPMIWRVSFKTTDVIREKQTLIECNIKEDDSETRKGKPATPEYYMSTAVLVKSDNLSAVIV